MLKKKLIYYFIPLLFFVGLFIFSYDALKKSVLYFRLDAQTKTIDVNLIPKLISDEKYAILGSYTYQVGPTKYSAESVMNSRYYRNEYAASMAIKKQSFPLTIFYSKKDPGISALERNFPIKELVYSLILVGGFMYFIGLGYYLKKRT